VAVHAGPLSAFIFSFPLLNFFGSVLPGKTSLALAQVLLFTLLAGTALAAALVEQRKEHPQAFIALCPEASCLRGAGCRRSHLCDAARPITSDIVAADTIAALRIGPVANFRR